MALTPQPSSTVTMQEVTHSTTVPCSLNITFLQNHDSLNRGFLQMVAMVLFQTLVKLNFQKNKKLTLELNKRLLPTTSVIDYRSLSIS